MKKTALLYSILFLFLSVNQSCKKDSNATILAATDAAGDQLETNAAVTADTSLLCYLPFKGNLIDKSGHGNNGVLNGTISYVADRFGNASRAASFAASNSWIEIPEAQFVGLNTLTIAMDFYPTSTNQQELMSKMSYSAPIGSPDFYQSFTIVLESDGSTAFDIRQSNFCNAADGSGWNAPLYSNAKVIYNSWNHLAITFRDNVQKMYLNGVLVATSLKTASAICQGEPLRLAVWWQSGPIYFTGNMDEVRIYKRVLSAKEIKQLSTQ